MYINIKSFYFFISRASANVPLKNFWVGMQLFWGTMWEDHTEWDITHNGSQTSMGHCQKSKWEPENYFPGLAFLLLFGQCQKV